MTSQVKKVTTLAMLSAIAYIVMAVGRIPITSIAFLKYDPKDIIIAIGGFIYGPFAALLMSVVTSFVEMVTVSDSGIIGMAMNIISTCAFACTAAAIYKRQRTLASAIMGLVIGCLAMTGAMLLWNFILTPLYMGITREKVVAMLAPIFLPFNLLKGGLNAAFTMLLYKPLVKILRRTNLVPEQEGASSGINYGVIIISLFVLATFILVIYLSKQQP